MAVKGVFINGRWPMTLRNIYLGRSEVVHTAADRLAQTATRISAYRIGRMECVAAGVVWS